MTANSMIMSVMAAIFVMIAFCSVGRAVVPLGTVNGELFTDTQCTKPFVEITTNWTEPDVALDGSSCQSFIVDGFTYSNVIRCSNEANNQYYTEQFWPNTKTCAGSPLWTFSHVGPAGTCNVFRGISYDRTQIFTAYSKLICSVDTPQLTVKETVITTSSQNSGTAMTYSVVGILSSILILLLTLA